jgi:hypothetical protein
MMAETETRQANNESYWSFVIDPWEPGNHDLPFGDAMAVYL